MKRPLALATLRIIFVAQSLEAPSSSTAQRLMRCPATDWTPRAEGRPGCWTAYESTVRRCTLSSSRRSPYSRAKTLE